MRVELSGIRPWRHDLGNCLHSALAVVLTQRRIDPLAVLGAAWRFVYLPGDVRAEEYYFPCDRGSLLASLAPYHPVGSRWHSPTDGRAAWDDVRAALIGGTPVIVAVDNFELPFRPAFRDVHSNHLVTVYGFDDEEEVAFVIDPVPPHFDGPLPLHRLAAARGSPNRPRHDRDMFFTGSPIAGRWMTVEVDGPIPALTDAFVREVIARNVEQWRCDRGREWYTGLAGARRFLGAALGAIAARPSLLDEVFVLAGTQLAAAALHADYLAAAAVHLGAPALAELAREVERVAHHWAALRIAVATARVDPAAATPGLLARLDRILADTALAVERLDGWQRRR